MEVPSKLISCAIKFTPVPGFPVMGIESTTTLANPLVGNSKLKLVIPTMLGEVPPAPLEDSIFNLKMLQYDSIWVILHIFKISARLVKTINGFKLETTFRT